MKLYHGSLDIVREPEIRQPNRTLDYGSGFYMTSSFEQAEAWVKRKLNREFTRGYVNVYEYILSSASGLKTVTFERPAEEWLDFVMSNRLDRKFKHDYDIVIGPVADDKVYASFALYEAGLIDKAELITELKTYKLVNQYLLHTTAALATISFIEAKEITL